MSKNQGFLNCNVINKSMLFYCSVVDKSRFFYCDVVDKSCLFFIQLIAVPSTPKFTIDKSLTTIQTISGSISQSDGGHDNFILDCDNIHNLHYSLNGEKYTIQNLIPGQLYQCQAWSTFCNHKSAKATSLKESTGLCFLLCRKLHTKYHIFFYIYLSDLYLKYNVKVLDMNNCSRSS